jgi:signal recognition particle subunit SRP72
VAETSVLRLDANSLPAFQTLLFLHLQIDDYAAALELVSSPPEGAGELQFEKAYCLYRLHREAEALEGLDKIGSKGRKEQHLDAQIVSRFLLHEDLSMS